MTLAGYHKHLRFGWISPRAFELISVANGDDNTQIKEKKYVEILFLLPNLLFKKWIYTCIMWGQNGNVWT